MFEQIAPYILALAALATAIIGLRKAMADGDSVAAKNWETLFNSFKKQVTDLEASDKENRARIKVLEQSEIEAVRQSMENKQKIKELEAANEQSKERLVSLEKDHTRLAEKFRQYQRGVNLLIGQLKELKVEPSWSPDSEDG